MLVSRDDLERSLTRVRAAVTDPGAGIYGPGTVAREVSREWALLLGGGAATLLQLAHPYVAHGVDQHSRTRDDVLARFQRTFFHIFAMCFDDLDRAFASARRVHAIHTRVTGEITEDVGRFRRGHRYRANDVEALRWVYATLIHTGVRVYERVVRPLTPREREQNYRETQLLAALFGIPATALPADWPAFERYFAATLESDLIAVGEPARSMRRFLLAPGHGRHAPLWRWYEVITAGLMPERLRAAYDLPRGPGSRAAFTASLAAFRALYRRLPRSVRDFPGYVAVDRRRRGLAPSRVSQRVERLLDHVLAGKSRGP